MIALAAQRPAVEAAALAVARQFGAAARYAYRWTWLAQKLAGYEAPGMDHDAADFGNLLRELAPAAYADLTNRSIPDCYIALLVHVNRNLFPICEGAFADFEDNYDEANPESFGDVWDSGIAFEPFGVELDEDEIVSPAVALCFALANFTNANGGEDYFAALKPWRDEMPAWLGPQMLSDPDTFRRPPPGRQWRGAWQGLADLYVYATGRTDNPFIYLSHSAQQETMSYPPWNRAEIDSLARYWREAEPIIKRAGVLVEYIEAKPMERIPLLAGALNHQRAVRERISEPQRERVRVRA